MWNINSVTLIGRLCRDVEIKNISNGSAVANFDIAVGGKPAKDGTPVTYYFSIVAWGKTAENCAKFLSKGKQCCVKGSLVQDRWVNKEGENRSRISVSADQVEFIGSYGSNLTKTNTESAIEDIFGDQDDVRF